MSMNERLLEPADDPLLADAHEARSRVIDGSLRGHELRDRLLGVPYLDRERWVDALLGLDPAPPDAADLPRGAVPYVPCGVDEIVAFAREVTFAAADQFVDLGSGLGRVVMLVHLLTGVRARGIEIQAALVRMADERRAELALSNVSFVRADVRDADLEGNVFFLYAPFNGEMRARVMARLRSIADQRRIVVCAVGVEFDEPWLARRADSSVSLAVYDSIRVSDRT
jgi:hypothetical protein